MAIQSVQKDKNGPDWPLGLIVVVTPGTPVSIMSLIDPTGVDDPGVLTTTTSSESTVRAQQIIFQAYKAGTHGLTNNTGNIYICRKGVQGAGNRDDYGSIVCTLAPGTSSSPAQTFILASAALNRDVFSPYRYSIDADNAGDSCLVTLVIQ